MEVNDTSSGPRFKPVELSTKVPFGENGPEQDEDEKSSTTTMSWEEFQGEQRQP